MSTKFQRYFTLTVQGATGALYEISNPLTLQFSINRMAMASQQTATFRILNLNQQKRGEIYRNKTDFDDVRSIKLQAGYANNNPLPTIFEGCVGEAYSCRESGSVDFITQIQAWSFNFSVVKSFSNFTIQPADGVAVKKQDVINRLVDDLIKSTPNSQLKKGFTASFIGTYPRGRTICAPTWQALKEETGRSCFIDNGRVFCLPQGEVGGEEILVIDSDSGLLSTPKRRETYLDIEILFEPNVDVGQKVYLFTRSSPQFNGTYKVLGIQHNGIISDAVGGSCKTILTLNFGEHELNRLAVPGV